MDGQTQTTSKTAASLEVRARTSRPVHSLLDKVVLGDSELAPPKTKQDLDTLRYVIDSMSQAKPFSLADTRVLTGAHSSAKLINQIAKHEGQDDFLARLMGIRDEQARQLAMMTPVAIEQQSPSFYPLANSVLLNSNTPGALVHELGHAIDLNKRTPEESNLRTNFRRRLKPLLLMEFAAWRKGRKAFQQGVADQVVRRPRNLQDPQFLDRYGKIMESYNRRKYPAFGTYVGGTAGAAGAGLGAAALAGHLLAKYDTNGALDRSTARILSAAGLGGAVLGGIGGAYGGGLTGRLWAAVRQKANKRKAVRQLFEEASRQTLDGAVKRHDSRGSDKVKKETGAVNERETKKVAEIVYQQVYCKMAAIKEKVKEEKKDKNKKPRTGKVKPETIKSKLLKPGLADLLPVGALGAGSLAYGGSRGLGYLSDNLASKAQIDAAARGFQAMYEPLPPNTTLLTQYAASMNPALNIEPFGLDLTEVLPLGRSNPYIMGHKALLDVEALRSNKMLDNAQSSLLHRLRSQGLATEGSTLERLLAKLKGKLVEKQVGPNLAGYLDANGLTGPLMHGAASIQPGVKGFYAGTPDVGHGARAHYKAFKQGPLAAVSHMMRGPRAPYQIQDATLLQNGQPITYNEYFTPRFERFVQSQMGGNILPNEVDLKMRTLEQQQKILQDFHASLSPAEQAEKVRIESGEMSGLQTGNTANYRPLVTYGKKGKELLEQGRSKAKDYAVVAGSAGVGGLTASRLYRLLRDKKKRSRLEELAASTAGVGAGGALGHYLGTEKGRTQVNNFVAIIKERLAKR